MNITLKNHTFKISPGINKYYWTHINVIDWEPHTFNILDFFIKKEAVVLDIGSWSGVVALYAAKTAKKVYALDPDPVCFKELENNIKLNPSISNKIKACKVAISHKKENLLLYARDSYGKSSTSILPRGRDTEYSSNIETITLSNFIKNEKIKHVDFIKMDVEGAEFKILPDIKKALKAIGNPTLYVSFHYHFLNENLYFSKIKSPFLNKLFIKLESLFKVSLFKNEIENQISSLFDDLKMYKYIYKTDGTLINFENLKNTPQLIKETDLVFTNTKWDEK